MFCLLFFSCGCLLTIAVMCARYGAERIPFANMSYEMVKEAKAKQSSEAKL